MPRSFENDSVIFPMLSSPYFIGRSLESVDESYVTSFNLPSEIQRLHNGEFLNIKPHDRNSFQFEPFPFSPPPNQFSGQAYGNLNSMDISYQQETTFAKYQRKHTIIDRRTNDEQEIMGRKSKRFKAARDDEASLAKEPAIVNKSQKLRDKITALQQLVSPFGKTDTASVLQEACVCIKALLENIRILSYPYTGVETSCFQRDGVEKFDLKGRGLYLCPIPSTTVSLIDRSGFQNRFNE